MSAVERPTDGPDTELAAEVNDALDQLIDTARREDWDGHKASGWGQVVRDELDRLRAVLARPAAGRDLTAQDVYDALGESDVFREGYAPVVDRLNGIARPAAARTDGQPPADRASARVELAQLIDGVPDGPWRTRRTADAVLAWMEREQRIRAAAPADDTGRDGST